MAIVDIQKRFRELGRIRTGEQVATGKTYQSGKKRGQPITRPTKLPRFRLTSPWAHLIEQAAEVFGGEVRPWHNDGTGGDEFEVIVDVDSLPVIIPPGDFFEQWYELWTGGGCARRCDGERQVLVDQPCRCPEDPLERQELAGKGDACKPTTRVRLMLPDVADVGIWRLESHGFHAAAELGGAAGLVEAAVRLGTMIPADLRLQSREGARRPGQPKKTFYVPAITFRGTLGPILDRLGILDSSSVMPALVGMERRPELDTGGKPALPPGGTAFDPAPIEESSFPETPVELPGAPALEDDDDPGSGELEPGDGFAPADVDDPGSLVGEPEAFDPPDRPPAGEDGEEGPSLTGPQMVAIKAKDRDLDRVEKLAFCSGVVGRALSSSKELTPPEVRRVLDVLSNDELFAEYAGRALDYLPADEPGPVEDGPIETTAAEAAPPAPAPAPARETRRRAPASSSTDSEPSAWDGDRWRAVLKERGVKVVAVLKEANRIARERDVKPPGTLDELKGSGLETELLGFVEASSEDGRA